MGDISEKFREVKLQLQRASMLLEELELSRGDEVSDVQYTVSKSCDELSRSIMDLRDMVDMEHSGKREVLKRKVRALQEEHQEVQQGLEKYLTGAHKRRQAAKSRRQLLTGAAADTGNGSAMHHLHEESNSIDKSTAAVNNFIREGQAVLEALRTQGSTLQTTGDRLGQFLNSMGLSKSIITTISRTHRTDGLIVYAGMIVITFMLFLIWWFK